MWSLRYRFPTGDGPTGSGSALCCCSCGVPGGWNSRDPGRAMEHVTEGAWESLQVPLHPRMLGALRELGFLHMTPVQVSVPRGREAEGSAAPVQPRESGREPLLACVMPSESQTWQCQTSLRYSPRECVWGCGVSALPAWYSWDIGQWLVLCPFYLRNVGNHFFHSIVGICRSRWVPSDRYLLLCVGRVSLAQYIKNQQTKTSNYGRAVWCGTRL